MEVTCLLAHLCLVFKMEERLHKLTQKPLGYLGKVHPWFILLLLLVGWFYWFQWRPQQARKDCIKFVYQKRDEPGELRLLEANQFYRNCLIEHGMKAEDLVNLPP